MEACLKESLASPTELEESLRNGVLLAKLGHFFAPDVVPLRKIYDLDQAQFQASVGLAARGLGGCARAWPLGVQFPQSEGDGGLWPAVGFCLVPFLALAVLPSNQFRGGPSLASGGKEGELL